MNALLPIYRKPKAKMNNTTTLNNRTLLRIIAISNNGLDMNWLPKSVPRTDSTPYVIGFNLAKYRRTFGNASTGYIIGLKNINGIVIGIKMAWNASTFSALAATVTLSPKMKIVTRNIITSIAIKCSGVK